MLLSKSTLYLGVVCFVAAVCNAATLDEASNLALNHRSPRILNRNVTSFIGEVNVTAFPSCAYANCIASDLFSPSRLGCIGGTLTTDCFCNTAPTPLSCAPDGPSNDDNCWYDLENWFATICGASVATIQPATMPECIQDCVSNYLDAQGCLTETRNCFCKVDEKSLLNATTNCQTQNCASKMQSSFVPSTWRDNICSKGNTSDYDQASYDKYVKMVHDTRIAVPVVMTLIAVILLIAGIACCCDEGAPAGICLIVTAVILILITVIPVYTVL